MIRKATIIAILLAWASYVGAVAYSVSTRDAQHRGGAWRVMRKASFTTTMTTSNTAKASDGTNLLALNYFTYVFVDQDAAVDSVVTMGLDSLGGYDPDSAGTDTTCLYLDGFVDESIDVIMYVNELERCTLAVFVEQALRYDTLAADTGFNWGFRIVDTLFSSSITVDFNLDGTNESIDVAAVTAAGAPTRQYFDTFTLIYPCLRLRICATGPLNDPLPGLMFEIYPRHNNTIMSGTSGRLLEMKPAPPGSNYNTNLRDR